MKRSTIATFVVRIIFLFLGLMSLSGLGLEPDRRRIEPLLLSSDEPAVVAAQRKVVGDGAGADLSVPVFLHLSTDDPNLSWKVANLSGNASRVAPRLFVGRIPRDAARYISNWPEIAYIESGKRVRHMLDLSRPAVFADDVQAGSPAFPAPFDAGISGNNVYVGVVDTGLSIAHLDFHTAGAGPASRVAHTYTSPGPFPPAVSANPLVDEDGHGTHVTGIAAGNGFSSGGRFTGMAPAASILFGKTSFFTTDIINAVDNLMAFAKVNGRPVAVNLSLGTAIGSHDGTSGFERGIGFLAADPAGGPRLIAVAAGNEQAANEHFHTALLPFGSTSLTVTFDGTTTSAAVEVWADNTDLYNVTIAMGSEGVTLLPNRSASSSRISASYTVSDPRNNSTFISVIFAPPSATGPRTATIQMARTRNGGTGVVDAYIDEQDGTFAASTSSGTIIEPANAPGILAVGSFNTKLGNFNSGAVGNISNFSSFGPTRDGRLKPDLTAPGSFIDSARSVESSLPPLSPPNDNYTRLAGTSMAAPHVTGIAALVWQSNPSLTGAQMRERLRRTATAVPPSPNTTWGFGKVNALNAVSNTVASITAPDNVPTGTAITVSADNSSGGFGAPITSFTWSAPGATVAPPNAANPTFSAVAPGNYSVSLIVNAGGLPASTSKTIRVNRVPTAAIAGPASNAGPGVVTFNGSSSSDPDGDPLAHNWVLVIRPVGSSRSLVPSGATASLTPDLAGTYTVGLRADDGLDNSALATHLFTAQSLAGAPIITSSPVTTVTVGSPYTYQVAAVGNPTIAFTLTRAPAGMTIDNTGLVRWTPPQGGVQSVEVRASNGIFSDAVQSFVVSVLQPGQTAPSSSAGGGGGGGCGVATGRHEPGDSSPLTTFLVILSPLGALAARRYLRSRVILQPDGGR